jgi:hypothetical protein
MATKRSAIALAVVLLALAGCMSFSVKTTGAASVDDLNAENAYIALYMDHMTTYSSDLKAFQRSGNDPGPCNKGGNAQKCFDVDAAVIADLTAMLSALEGTKVPPRYVEADRLLRDALRRTSRAQSAEPGHRARRQHAVAPACGRARGSRCCMDRGLRGVSC